MKSVRPLLIVLLAFSAGCSPYVYKSEINGFDLGVKELGAAYVTGRKGLADDRAIKNRWEWLDSRAKLAPTRGCVVSIAVAPSSADPCALHPIGGKVPEISQAELAAGKATGIVVALQDYSAGLAAITNAGDREALDAAQAQLKKALQNATKLAAKENPSAVQGIGVIADLFAEAGGAILDTRRYKALRAGVTAAQEPVKVLGNALGETLDTIRFARGQELNSTVTALGEGLGPSLDNTAYSARINALQEKVTALEALRLSNPKKAANDMVDAHNKLTEALRDDTRQIDSVFIAVKTFVDSAEAVKTAFGKNP